MTTTSSYLRVFQQTDNDTARESDVELLLIGLWHKREFTVIQPSIQETYSCRGAVGIDEAIDYLATASVAPELMLLAQPLPGEVRQAQIDRLQRLAPLARIVLVAGTWCEGERRNVKPVAGTLRLYWYELPAWLQAARKQIEQRLCPCWSQPLDGSSPGRWTSRSNSATTSTSSGLVAVATGDYSLYETWAAALREFGRPATWRRLEVGANVPREVTAGIWDGGQLSASESRSLALFCEQVQGAGGRVVAILDFPRQEHFQLTKDFGVHALFGKPYVVEEVLAAVLT